MLHDHAMKQRQEFIQLVQSREFKVRQAIERMGTRWILHPANQIQRKTPINGGSK